MPSKGLRERAHSAAEANRDREARELQRREREAREGWVGYLALSVLGVGDPPSLTLAPEQINGRAVGWDVWAFEIDGLTFQAERENGSQCPWKRLHLTAKDGKAIKDPPWIGSLSELGEVLDAE